MNPRIFSRIFLFLLLILLQAFVFNHINLGGYATPMPAVYFLLLASSESRHWFLVLEGFVLGIELDMFGNTPGIHAASLTFAGLVLPLVLRIFWPSDREDDAFTPSARTLGWQAFSMFALVMVFIHVTLFCVLESFSSFGMSDLLNICGSIALSFLFILAMERIHMSISKAE